MFLGIPVAPDGWLSLLRKRAGSYDCRPVFDSLGKRVAVGAVPTQTVLSLRRPLSFKTGLLPALTPIRRGCRIRPKHMVTVSMTFVLCLGVPQLWNSMIMFKSITTYSILRWDLLWSDCTSNYCGVFRSLVRCPLKRATDSNPMWFTESFFERISNSDFRVLQS